MTDRGWLLLATASGVVAAFAVRHALQHGWRLAHDDEPPLNPAAPETPWRDAVAWTLAVGAGAGLARLAARRGVSYLREQREDRLAPVA